MTIKPIEQKMKEIPAVAIVQRTKSPVGYYFYCDILKIVRDPAAIIFGILFPSAFFLIFSNTLNVQYTQTLLAQYAAYGSFVVSFQTFSIIIATERSQGWTRLLRTTSVNTMLYLGSKFLVVMFTGFSSILLLCILAVLIGKVQMAPSAWLELLGFMAYGMIPFALAGIFLGFFGTSSMTQVVSTIVSIFLSITSGFFVPLQFMPKFVREIAVYLPTYHLGQIALHAIGSSSLGDGTPLGLHLLALSIFAFVFALLAIWAYFRDENKNYA